MEQGYLALVLHCHLPFIRHPEHPEFLEEDWFYEAITETYIPLIQVFERLIADRVPFRITLSITPTLAAMLSDPLLQERYLHHIHRLVELSESEIRRTAKDPTFNRLARMYRGRFEEARRLFEDRYRRNLLAAFRAFQDEGSLEIITCAATHGYLPLMSVHPRAVRAQIRVGASEYRRHFGRPARGIWLPECGYYPGVDAFLAEEKIRFFFVDTHGINHAVPRPKYGVYAPIYCRSRVAAFARDIESSKQVWSAVEGYPGDYNYRDFYRDIGFDLDLDYIRPYIHEEGIRIHTGIKYHRITGKTDRKEPYVPEWAMEKAAEHAGNFMFNRERQIEHLSGAMRRPPIVVAPYDAELFGHWWFEGPQWIDFLIRKSAYDQRVYRLITPSDYLAMHPRVQVGTPSNSSWGYKGYHEVWLEGSNDWIYRYLHQAAGRMIELADRHPHASGLLQRALNQAGRELLLAQSSDWAFIMKNGTTVSYAVRRTKEHLLRFTRLCDEIDRNAIDEGRLKEIEGRDNLFPEINFRVWGSNN
jgi:1,4-alpha-glucan branching enzyme